MVDLHTHILPGMDDGSRDIPTSLQLLQTEQAQGVSLVCVTPHFYAHEETPQAFCARRARALQQLQEAVRADTAHTYPRILPAAEVAYFPHISDSPALDDLCIAGTRTLLLEMPFAEWQDFQREELISLLLDRGYQLVLVHPERFYGSRNNRRQLGQLLQYPIGLQINGDALIKPVVRRLALALLQDTAYPLLGSDCHNPTTRPPNLETAKKVLQKSLGANFLAQVAAAAQKMIAPEYSE